MKKSELRNIIKEELKKLTESVDKIKISKLTPEYLISNIESKNLTKKYKSTHGISVKLPDYRHGDANQHFALEKDWGKSSLQDWKREFIKKWGDSNIIIDFSKSSFKIDNEKFNNWRETYTKI